MPRLPACLPGGGASSSALTHQARPSACGLRACRRPSPRAAAPRPAGRARASLWVGGWRGPHHAAAPLRSDLPSLPPSQPPCPPLTHLRRVGRAARRPAPLLGLRDDAAAAACDGGGGCSSCHHHTMVVLWSWWPPEPLPGPAPAACPPPAGAGPPLSGQWHHQQCGLHPCCCCSRPCPPPRPPHSLSTAAPPRGHPARAAACGAGVLRACLLSSRH